MCFKVLGFFLELGILDRISRVASFSRIGRGSYYVVYSGYYWLR